MVYLPGLFELNGSFATTSLFWDCECEENYVHPVTEDKCPGCNARREDQLPSRISEVICQSSRLPRGLIEILESIMDICGQKPPP